MQNDFEKDIAQRMQEFSIYPQPEIWQQVEATLPLEKKRRRILLWWWMLPLAGLLGAGFWMTERKHRQAVEPENPAQVSKEKIVHQPAVISQNETSQQPPDFTPADTASRHPFTKIKSTQYPKITTTYPAKNDTVLATTTLKHNLEKLARKRVALGRYKQLIHDNKATKPAHTVSRYSAEENRSPEDIITKQSNLKKQNSPLPQAATIPTNKGFAVETDSITALAVIDTVQLSTNTKAAVAPIVDTIKGATDSAAIAKKVMLNQ